MTITAPAVGTAVGTELPDGIGVGSGLADGTGVGTAVADDVGIGDTDGIGVDDGVGVDVANGLGVADGPFVGVADGFGLLETMGSGGFEIFEDVTMGEDDAPPPEHPDTTVARAIVALSKPDGRFIDRGPLFGRENANARASVDCDEEDAADALHGPLSGVECLRSIGPRPRKRYQI